jgi:thioredoxin 2
MADDPVPCPRCAQANRVPRTASGSPRCGRCGAPLPWLVEADDRDFAEVASSRLPVLVDLWAAWCGPCRTVAPAVARAARDYAGRLKVVKVDVDAAPAVAAQFGARSIPTLLLLRDGLVVARQVGAVPADRLLEWVGAELADRPAAAGR